MQNDEIKCPYCAEIIKADAKICKHCKSQLKPIDGTPAARSTPQPPEPAKKKGLGWLWIPIILIGGFIGSIVLGLGGIVGQDFFSSMSKDAAIGARAAASETAARTDVSDLKNYGELAQAFNPDSKYTDLQRDKLRKEIKGRLVVWRVQVYEIKKTGVSKYTIQTKSDLFDKQAPVGLFIELTTMNANEDKFMEGLKTDDYIMVKGVLTGDTTMRHLEMSPAILWNPEEKKEQKKEEVVPQATPAPEQKESAPAQQQSANPEPKEIGLNVLKIELCMTSKADDFRQANGPDAKISPAQTEQFRASCSAGQ